MSRPRSLAAITGLVIGLAACGGSNAPTAIPVTASAPTVVATAPSSADPSASSPAPAASQSPAATPFATVLPTASAVPTAPTAAFTLTSNVWWSGFDITFTGGTYDVAKHTLTIDASFTNTATQASELRNLSDGTSVSWNGQVLPAFESSGLIAAGATTIGQITVTAVPVGFEPGTAVLTFGKSGQHQALVPLDGSETTFDRVAQLSVTGKLTMGKYVTYTITRAELVPASCSGYPDRIKYGAQAADKVSLVIFGTATSKDSTNYRWIDKGYLVLPDGTKQASDPVMTLSLPLSASVPNVMMCFALATPFNGTFTLKMHENRSNTTGSLVLDLT